MRSYSESPCRSPRSMPTTARPRSPAERAHTQIARSRAVVRAIDVLLLVHAAVVATTPLADAIGWVALMAQADTGAPIGFLIEGAARGGAVDQMDDQRTVHRRGFPRHIRRWSRSGAHVHSELAPASWWSEAHDVPSFARGGTGSVCPANAPPGVAAPHPPGLADGGSDWRYFERLHLLALRRT